MYQTEPRHSAEKDGSTFWIQILIMGNGRLRKIRSSLRCVNSMKVCLFDQLKQRERGKVSLREREVILSRKKEKEVKERKRER